LLYSFKGGTDGSQPAPGLSAFGGKLYGVTYGGGSTRNGNVFAFSPPSAR
jgi:uncharacterized repeat protein (TIGR03803 family)